MMVEISAVMEKTKKYMNQLIPGYLDGVTGEYGAPKGYYVDEKITAFREVVESAKENIKK